jgi:hypothetical protein
VLPIVAACLAYQTPSHAFTLGPADFVLDGKPFQIRSGEMHPARIPAEYWRHRIRMAKAMGLNTIAAYIFWNYQEPSEGRYDFRTGNHDIARFFRICQEEGMWVLVRPGPYCCAEWDFGGIPSYLLKYPDLRVRCMDPRYIAAAGRYLGRLADVLRPLQVSHGGPILMLQIENEYGSYGNDRGYVKWLSDFWRGHGFDIPFYTADGPTTSMLSAGSLAGCAVGLDSGGSLDDWTLAASLNPGVPIFSSETYPGWLTHWGENWARTSTASISREVQFLLSNHKSFNVYVVHGGTNFGLTAGANTGGHGYEPDITSYDYDAPISENGSPTPKYFALRGLIAASLPPGEKLPDVPAPLPAMALPAIPMERTCSLWGHLSAPIAMAQPRTFESFGQNQGLVLYRARLIGHTSGNLVVHGLHDFATVFVDGRTVGTLDRREGRTSIQLPETASKAPVLDLLVEAMGHVNFGDAIIDPKGITDRVVLDGMTLMDWQAFSMPLDVAWLARQTPAAEVDRPGTLFRGSFTIEKPMDTYLDLSVYDKGYVWVNGHCLGRYWNIGPQKRLYCPASFLRPGANTLTVLDLLRFTPASVSGYPGPS